MILTKRRVLLVIGASVGFYLALIWAVMTVKSTETNSIKAENAVPREPNPSMHQFRPENGDVFVFFHVQKSGGGTFNGHLVNLDIKPRCSCSTDPPTEGACRCTDTQGYLWLYSRFTAASSCGVHPPFQELFDCVPKFVSAAEGHDENTKKRYLYITIIRDPVKRYISEWRHLQTVSPWPTSCHHTPNAVESCIKASSDRPGLSLKDFIQCPGNPASNRLVRMLTQDSEHLCDNIDSGSILSRAKEVLESLAFVGLTDEQVLTKVLFQATFGVHFLDIFQERNATVADTTLRHDISDDLLNLIRENNKLDIELYNYATMMFHRRLHESS